MSNNKSDNRIYGYDPNDDDSWARMRIANGQYVFGDSLKGTDENENCRESNCEGRTGDSH